MKKAKARGLLVKCIHCEFGGRLADFAYTFSGGVMLMVP